MKKTIIILILILITAGGIFWYINNSQKSSTGVEPTSGESKFKSFFSFLQNGNSVDTNGSDSEDGEVDINGDGVIDEGVESPTIDTSKLKQVTDFAVAGIGTFVDTRPLPESAIPVSSTPPTTNTKTAPKVPELPKEEYVSALRYVASSNGHVYGEYLDTEATAKVSNSTIPSIYEAFFGNNGKSVVYRYLSDNNTVIQSFAATLGTTTSQFLQENIQGVTVSPNGGSLFYLAPLGDDIAGYVMSFDDLVKTQVLISAFTEWLPQWAGVSTVFLTTKPSWDTPGSLYATNLGRGNLTKVFGGIKGLTTLASNNAEWVIYSGTTNQGPELGLYRIEDRTFSKLPVRTLADKCVWSKDAVTVYCARPNRMEGNRYPDDWYKGRVSFDDSILKIDTSQKSYTTLINTEDSVSLDAINLKLSADEKILFMINKKDSTLWSLNLE